MTNKTTPTMLENPSEEIKELATYIQGMADATHNQRLAAAADWLERAADNICAQGYFGCKSGDRCTSDHK